MKLCSFDLLASNAFLDIIAIALFGALTGIGMVLAVVIVAFYFFGGLFGFGIAGRADLTIGS